MTVTCQNILEKRAQIVLNLLELLPYGIHAATIICLVQYVDNKNDPHEDARRAITNVILDRIELLVRSKSEPLRHKTINVPRMTRLVL